MSLLKLPASFFFLLILCSCGPDKSGYVDVPTDHGDELKINQSSPEEMMLRAGNYENLLLAIDSNKISALYIAKGQNCYFIETQFSKFSAETSLSWKQIGSNMKGEGKFTAEKDAVWIQFNGTPSGCAPQLFKSPQKLPLVKLNNWKIIKTVERNSIEISSEPLDGMKIGQSFKRGDVICILEAKKEWLRVEKIAQSPQVGWIKTKDLE
jgi:hypothetical protein